jgi:osmoprotectant transport system ATP-binding protein
MVNRLVEPTTGKVLIDGENAADVDVVALRRRIGYVIQQVGLFPHQTVRENVATVPRLLGWPKDRVIARVDELLNLVGLEPGSFARRYPAQLSGGQRQRVGVARALAAEPPLLLMDEPFGAVDPIVRERLQDEFLRLQRTLGTTVLFVTHDVDEAIKLGDRVAVMREGGHLAQYSPPAELLLSPATDYVARFIGGDRILKRLALMRVGDIPLEPAIVGHEATSCPSSLSVREALSRLLVTADGRLLIVNEADGSSLGVLTMDSVATALRSGERRASSLVDAWSSPGGNGAP